MKVKVIVHLYRKASETKDFLINKIEEPKLVKDSSVLEINVFDAIRGKDLGPGQR